MLAKKSPPELKVKLVDRFGFHKEANLLRQFLNAMNESKWLQARELCSQIVDQSFLVIYEASIVREQFLDAWANGMPDEHVMAILRDYSKFQAHKTDKTDVNFLATLLVNGSSKTDGFSTVSARETVIDKVLDSFSGTLLELSKAKTETDDPFCRYLFTLEDARLFECATKRHPHLLEAFSTEAFIVQSLSTLGFDDLAKEAAEAWEMAYKPDPALHLYNSTISKNWGHLVDALELAEEYFFTQEGFQLSVKLLMLTAVRDLISNGKTKEALKLARHPLGTSFRGELGAALCSRSTSNDTPQKCWDKVARHLRPDLCMSPELPFEILKMADSFLFMEHERCMCENTSGNWRNWHHPACEEAELGDCIHTKHVLQEDDEVWELAFSDDGAYLATGTKSGKMSIYSTQDSFKLLSRISVHNKGIQAMQFSPCGRYVATGSADSTVSVWDLNQSERLFYVQHHEEGIGSVCWLRDGQHLVSGGLVGELAMWNMNGVCVWRFVRERILSLAQYGDDQLFALGVIKPESQQLLFRFDSKNWEFVDEMTLAPGLELTSIATSEHSPFILANDRGSESVVLFDPSDRKRSVASCRGPKHREFKILSSYGGPLGKYVVSGSEDGEVKLFLRAKLQRLASLKGHSALVTTVKWSPSDALFASASDDHTVRVWERDVA